MKIYRYEDPNTGDGPYRFPPVEYCNCGARRIDHCEGWCDYVLRYEFCDELCGEHADAYHPPTREIAEHEYVGMSSRADLEDWFYDFNESLIDYGFSMVCYDTESYRTTCDGQILFDKRDAISVLTIVPTTAKVVA
jgi:hypothetical protein